MKKIVFVYLITMFSLIILIGCESQHKKEADAAREQLKRKIGDVDKDLENIRKTRQKPKPGNILQ